MNVSQWVMYSGDHTQAKLVASFATSVPFDVAHAVGNAVFCLAFGPALVHALARFRTRLEVRWEPAAGIAAAGAVVAALVLAAAAPAPPARADAIAQAARSSQSWLLRAQNADGGWGSAPGAASSGLYTGWAALGVAASGTNPRDAGSPSVVAWLQSHPGQLTDLGAISRTVLVLRAAGVPARVGSRDLVATVASRQQRDGSFQAAGQHDGVRDPGAPRRRPAGGSAPPCGARRTGSPARPTPTAASTSPAAAGPRAPTTPARRCRRSSPPAAAGPRPSAGPRAGSPPTRTATAASRCSPAGSSNAQSTAWAVQGLIAAGRSPRRAPRLPALADHPLGPRALLEALQPDAGVGHRPGRDGAGPQAAAARAGRAQGAPCGRLAGACAGRERGAGGDPGGDRGPGPSKPAAHAKAAKAPAAKPRSSAATGRSFVLWAPAPGVVARTAGFVAGTAAAVLLPAPPDGYEPSRRRPLWSSSHRDKRQFV